VAVTTQRRRNLCERQLSDVARQGLIEPHSRAWREPESDSDESCDDHHHLQQNINPWFREVWLYEVWFYEIRFYGTVLYRVRFA
jgi:hypothetical protein